MTPRAVVSSVDEPPGRSDLGGRRTPQLQVRTTAVPAEAGRGRRSESPQLKPTILTLPRPWVVTRGVCLDVAALRGVPVLEPGYEITRDDVDRAAERQGVEIRHGDVVLLHTGTLRDVKNKAEFSDTEPGLGLEAARHLVEDFGVVALGSDNWALEVIPAADPEDFLPVHGVTIQVISGIQTFPLVSSVRTSNG